jgi:hypothetical protein
MRCRWGELESLRSISDDQSFWSAMPTLTVQSLLYVVLLPNLLR